MYPDTEEAKALIAELCRLFYDQVRTQASGVPWHRMQARLSLPAAMCAETSHALARTTPYSPEACVVGKQLRA